MRTLAALLLLCVVHGLLCDAIDYAYHKMTRR